MNKSCACCNENDPEILYHDLVSNQTKIEMCDSCYQELSRLEKRNNEWIEFVAFENVEYMKLGGK